MAFIKLQVNEETVLLDEQYFLINPSEWTSSFPEALAPHLKIELTPLHWQMITLLRTHYDEKGKVPTLRYVIEQLRENSTFKDINSSTLYRAFTAQPLKQACQLGGLPKPPHCL